MAPHRRGGVEGEPALLGGPQLLSDLEEAGLVDEYALFVHPSALGAGVPFFRRRLDLKLVDVRRFDMGVLALRYSTQLRD